MPVRTCLNLVSSDLVEQLDYMIIAGTFQLKIFYSSVPFFSLVKACSYSQVLTKA